MWYFGKNMEVGGSRMQEIQYGYLLELNHKKQSVARQAIAVVFNLG